MLQCDAVGKCHVEGGTSENFGNILGAMDQVDVIFEQGNTNCRLVAATTSRNMRRLNCHGRSCGWTYEAFKKKLGRERGKELCFSKMETYMVLFGALAGLALLLVPFLCSLTVFRIVTHK